MIIFIVTLGSMSYVRACDACMCLFAFLLWHSEMLTLAGAEKNAQIYSTDWPILQCKYHLQAQDSWRVNCFSQCYWLTASSKYSRQAKLPTWNAQQLSCLRIYNYFYNGYSHIPEHFAINFMFFAADSAHAGTIGSSSSFWVCTLQGKGSQSYNIAI